MPYPARIDPDEILSEARRLLEEGGVEAVSMRELGRRLGVKAPSLYFHVASREALVGRLVDQGLDELAAILAMAAPESTPLRQRLHAMADAYELFAYANRQLFALLFAPRPPETRAGGADDDESAGIPMPPMLESFRDAIPENTVLAVSQAVLSMIHGYTALVLADQFTLGSDPAQSIHFAIDLMVDGIEGRRA